MRRIPSHRPPCEEAVVITDKAQRCHMSMLVFEKSGTVDGSTMAYGTLTFAGKKFSAVSGGFGKGQLPNGAYRVETRKAVDQGLAKGFVVGSTQFFIPITPGFTSGRSGLGIHPDGRKKGTLGCIGLQGSDAKKFWKLWMAKSVASRPTKLVVRPTK